MTAKWIDHLYGHPLTEEEIALAVEGGINAGDLGMSPEPGQLWDRVAER